MNTVLRDYGLDESSNDAVREGAPHRKGTVRRVWELVQVSADPTKEGHFYAVQQLRGDWKKVDDNDYEVEWIPRDDRLPPVTRVIYCTLDEKGAIVNLNSPQAKEKIKQDITYGSHVPRDDLRSLFPDIQPERPGTFDDEVYLGLKIPGSQQQIVGLTALKSGEPGFIVGPRDMSSFTPGGAK